MRDMTVFVVVVEDRHTDTEPHLFANREAALAFAHRTAAEYADEHCEITVHNVPDCIYSATMGEEGDAVWVVEREVDMT